jgi:hypothetical protein
MSEYEIELVLKHGHSVIGEADDATEALNLMDEAMRRFPTGHIRIRRGITIVSERVPPSSPKSEAATKGSCLPFGKPSLARSYWRTPGGRNLHRPSSEVSEGPPARWADRLRCVRRRQLPRADTATASW